MVDKLDCLQAVTPTGGLCFSGLWYQINRHNRANRLWRGTRVHTVGNLSHPGLSGLDGIRRVGIGGNAEMYLVLFTPLEVAFTQYEHTPGLQAPDELSDSRRIVCYLE